MFINRWQNDRYSVDGKLNSFINLSITKSEKTRQEVPLDLMMGETHGPTFEEACQKTQAQN